jgi:hypothetical protein
MTVPFFQQEDLESHGGNQPGHNMGNQYRTHYKPKMNVRFVNRQKTIQIWRFAVV